MGSGPLMIGAEDVAALRPPDPLGPSRLAASDRARGALRGLLADRKLALPVAVLLALVLFAVFVPIAWNHKPDAQNLLGSLQGPSFAHPMGTDQLGRDILARVASGARISLVAGTLIT